MFEKSSIIRFVIERRYITEKTGAEYINVRFPKVRLIDASLLMEGRRIVNGERIDAGVLAKIDEILIPVTEKDKKLEFDAIVIEYIKFETLEKALEMALGCTGCWINSSRKMQEYLGNNAGKIGLHNQEVVKLESKK